MVGLFGFIDSTLFVGFRFMLFAVCGLVGLIVFGWCLCLCLRE